MSIIPLQHPYDVEPTAADLAAIEREWPLIAADLERLDAEISLINAGPLASTLDRRRIRRAENRVLAARRQLAAQTETPEVA
ncbi:DUF6284 family protein [Kribbella deserti]|uniref:DUF6284 family protein n=1 Tax=Kribbella deserti TaxID=1926257 RepID=A0ABV6QJD2_9ACTN